MYSQDVDSEEGTDIKEKKFAPAPRIVLPGILVIFPPKLKMVSLVILSYPTM